MTVVSGYPSKELTLCAVVLHCLGCDQLVPQMLKLDGRGVNKFAKRRAEAVWLKMCSGVWVRSAQGARRFELQLEGRQRRGPVPKNSFS